MTKVAGPTDHLPCAVLRQFGASHADGGVAELAHKGTHGFTALCAAARQADITLELAANAMLLNTASASPNLTAIAIKAAIVTFIARECAASVHCTADAVCTMAAPAVVATPAAMFVGM